MRWFVLTSLVSLAVALSVIPNRPSVVVVSDYYDTDADFDRRVLPAALVLTEGTTRGRALLADERLAECYQLARIDTLTYGSVQRVYRVR